MGIDEFRNEEFLLDDEEDSSGDFLESSAPVAASPRVRSRRMGGNFLGLTPPQRLVLSVMLFVEVCIVGMFILIATGRVVPPGMY